MGEKRKKICSICGKECGGIWMEEYTNIDGEYICSSCVDSLIDNQKEMVFMEDFPRFITADKVVKVIKNKDDFDTILNYLDREEDPGTEYYYDEWEDNYKDIEKVYPIDIVKVYPKDKEFYTVGQIFNPKKELVSLDKLPSVCDEWLEEAIKKREDEEKKKKDKVKPEFESAKKQLEEFIVNEINKKWDIRDLHYFVKVYYTYTLNIYIMLGNPESKENMVDCNINKSDNGFNIANRKNIDDDGFYFELIGKEEFNSLYQIISRNGNKDELSFDTEFIERQIPLNFRKELKK